MSSKQPGTIANDKGDIWIYNPDSPAVSDSMITTGTVALNPEQAAEAIKYGWKLVSIDADSGLHWMRR